MKNVLMIAYYFPPLGGAGVQRTLNYVNHLPDFGWKPTVVSVKNNRYYIKDFSLLKRVRKDVEIVRLSGFEFLNYYHSLKRVGLHKIVSLLDKITSVPDSQIFWGLKVLRMLPKLININDFQVIYSTFGPGTNLLIGYLISKKYNKPLVVDFRDEWSNSPQVDNRFLLKIKKPIFKNLEKKVIRNSSYVICLNDIMKKNFIYNYPRESIDKFVVIPNGFDNLYNKQSKIKRKNLFEKDKLNIVYSGSFYGFQKPTPFLKALEMILKDNPYYKDKLRVYFIGNVKTDELVRVTKKKLFKDVISILPYIEHERLIDYLLDSDLLLLIIGNVPKAEEIYTGKLFEYLAIGKPIFAIVPINGVAADLIKKTDSGFIVNNDDIIKIYREFKKIIANWEEGRLCINQKMDEVLKYSASNLTKILSEIFNRLI